MINTETLSFLLKELHLNAIESMWEQTSKQAEKDNWTYPYYLAALCDKEVAVRQQALAERNLLRAKLPVGKTLDTFQFNEMTSVNAAQISAFAGNPYWVNNAQNLIIFGPCGVGKTHLAAAIGRRLVECGIRVFFTKTTALVQKLQIAYNEHKLAKLLAQLSKYDLLILDDIGYVKKSEAEISVLFELIADRYESKSLLVTSSQTFDQWDNIFPNSVIAVAALDRLVHHSTIVNINAPSYRMKGQEAKNKQNLSASEQLEHTIAVNKQSSSPQGFEINAKLPEQELK